MDDGEQDVSEQLPENSAADSTEAEEREYTMADAFAAATAKLGEPEGKDSAEANSTPEATPAEEAPKPTTLPEPTPRMYTEQAAIDRIMTLHRQGRLHELPPEVQGQVKKLVLEERGKALQEREEEQQFLRLYLDKLAQRDEDPAAYLAQIEGPEGDDLKVFMKGFAEAHPEVTLDNPAYGPKVPTADEIREEALGEVATRLTDSLRALASDYGVTNFDQIREVSRGQNSLLVTVIDAAVKTKVAAELDAARKAEREATRKEVMAEYGNRIPALPISGSGRVPSRNADRSRPAASMNEAYQRALEAQSA